ncbi:MAG TPA: hypothetical protein VGR02_09775 [Thermoanaerobaculia bacterium]|jgi:hypothetical protein|nr:hypothetical protein [Thermoanaerobaculia bacterium]
MVKAIGLGEAQTLQAFEQVMRTHLRPSMRSSQVAFDLRNLRSIGFLPATLLFCWVASLRNADRVAVRMQLPSRDLLANSDARLLLDSEILRQISALGAEVEYDSPSVGGGIPLEILSAAPKASLLDRIADQLRSSSSELGEDMIRDLSHGVLFELLENAADHGDAKTAYFVARNVAANVKQDPFFPVFPKAESYFEVAVGDIGPGIRGTLLEYMPEDYQPPFSVPHPLSETERVMFHAFEYESTRSSTRRRERLRQHHRDSNIDPSRVATGLSCVLNIVRSRHGQLVIRTGNAILSFDFWKGSTPIVRTGRAVSDGPLVEAPGTQYLLRLPARRLSLQVGFSRPLPESALLDSIEVVKPFEAPAHSSHEADRVSAAIDYMATHFRERIKTSGISIVRPSRIPLTTRGGALFSAAMTMQNRGSRHLLCLERYSGESKTAGNTAYVPPPSHDVGVILEGDLYRNSFQNIRRGGTDVPAYLAELHDGRYSVNKVIVSKARSILGRSIRSDLQNLLASPSVRLTEGPFLIEGQYYTNAFYTVMETAVRDPYYAELLAQWVASALPEECDTLVAVTRPVIPLIPRIEALVNDMRDIRLRIVCADDVRGLQPHEDEWMCVALTDVICRGAVLNAALAAVQPATVTGALTFVDARPDTSDSDVFDYAAGGNTRSTAVRAIVRDELQTFSSAADAVRARGGTPSAAEQQLSISFSPDARIIDPNVHRPTVYVRETDSRGELAQLLDAARKADALLYQHAARSRHYSIFLHFPRLFRALRPEIEKWLNVELRKIPAGRKRRCIISDIDGSLSWLRLRLAQSHPAISVEEVGMDDIRAPRPPIERVAEPEHAIVVLPGSASGDLARRALEYASRDAPATITLLILVARMEPSHLSFLLGLTEYRGIPTRTSCFARFPVRAYPDELSCPICLARTAIEHILDVSKQPSLRKVLERKLALLAPIDLAGDVDEKLFSASEDEVRRAKLRALYEASEYDLHARYELTSCLDRDVSAIDDFLEVIAAEYRSEHFSISMIRRRLLTTFDRVIARVSDLLSTATPPISLASRLTALALLAEDVFVVAVPRLLSSYASSRPEMEELCIILARLRLMPAVILPNDVAPEPDDPQVLLLETIDYLNTPLLPDDSAAFLQQIETLYARLVRSSLVTERIPKLQAAASRSNTSMATIEEMARYVYDGWTADVAELLARLLRNRHWPPFANRHTRIADDVATLAQTMNDIRQIANDPARLPRTALRELTAHVDTVRKRLAEQISGLFISPIYCAAARLPQRIVKEKGAIIVRKEIDREVPRVFADFKTLEDVCDEISSNWVKHSGDSSVQVRVRIHHQDPFVVMELADNIPGDVKRLSVGGIRVMDEFCHAYAGAFQCADERDADGMKSILLFLRVQSDES